MAKSKTESEQPATQIGELIHRLGPINNKCRHADGIDKVELLWDLGDALLDLTPDANDQLLREIHERSYITRDIMRYGLIIRRGWQDRDDLRSQFPRLSRYSLFREALPFLKGDRCGIDDKMHRRVVEHLNAADTRKTKSYLKQLKQENIGRKHKKGKAADRMSEPAGILRSAIRQLIDLAEANPSQLASLAESVGDDTIMRLSQVCVAVADDATIPKIPSVDVAHEPIASVRTALATAASASRDNQNGFRKAVGAIMLMELADLLNAIRSDERLQQWHKRRRMSLSL